MVARSPAITDSSVEQAVPSETIPPAPAPSPQSTPEPVPPYRQPRQANVPLPDTGSGIDLRSALGPLAERTPRPRRRQLTPAEKEARRERKRRGPSRRIPFVLAIVFLLALATVLVAGGMWYYQGRQRAQLFTEFLDGARVNYNAAVATDDSGQAREYLKKAEEQLDQADMLLPEQPEVEQMRRQIAETRARINQVVSFLTGFDLPLIRFDPASQAPVQVLVDGLSIYILDTRRGVLERYQLDENAGDRLSERPPEVLVQTGMTVGGRRVNELAYATLAPAAGNRLNSGILVLDRSNQLFNYSDGVGVSDARLVENPDLGFANDMAYFFGNVYLLDKTNSQIWRYRPNGDLYDVPAEPYFSDGTMINLAPVIDMAIDGAVWLLNPNGSILRYFSGVQEPFALDAIDPPFSDAVAMWADEVDPPLGRLYLADAASNRILAFDKTGKLLAQLMPADHPQILNSLRSIYVDSDNNYLYALTADALYQVPIPVLSAY